MEKIQNLNLVIEAALEAGRAILEIYDTDFDIELKKDLSPLTKADKKAHQIITGFLSKTNLPVLSEEGREIFFQERKKWNKFWMVDPLDGTKEFIKKNGEFTVNIALVENGRPVMGVVYAPVLDILYFGDDTSGAFKIAKALGITTKKSRVKDWMSYSKPLPSFSGSKIYRVIASRSHLSEETKEYIEKKRIQHKGIELVSKGSSLKLCMIAEGYANIYPRFAPTMEWDTAAGHAIINASGGRVVQAGNNNDLIYNKENLLNPWFIAFCKENKNKINNGR